MAAKGNWQNGKKRNGFFYQRERRYYYDAFIHVSAAMQKLLPEGATEQAFTVKLVKKPEIP